MYIFQKVHVHIKDCLYYNFMNMHVPLLGFAFSLSHLENANDLLHVIIN